MTSTSASRNLGCSGNAGREPGGGLFSRRPSNGWGPPPFRRLCWSAPNGTAGPSKLWVARPRGRTRSWRKAASALVASSISVFGLSGLVATSGATIALFQPTQLVSAQQARPALVGNASSSGRPSGLSGAPAGLRSAVREYLDQHRSAEPPPLGLNSSDLQLRATYDSSGAEFTGAGFRFSVGRGSLGRQGEMRPVVSDLVRLPGAGPTPPVRSKSRSGRRRPGSSSPSSSQGQ